MTRPERPLRYRGTRQDDEERPPSVAATYLLSAIAVLLTCLVAIWVLSPDPNNVPGDIIRDVIAVAFVWWFDRHVIGRWRKIRAPAPD